MIHYSRQAALGDPERLETLHRLGLVDAPVNTDLQSMMVLMERLLQSSVALVSLVDEQRQYFSAMVGLQEPWASCQQTPLTHSFCQHVVLDGKCLEVEDSVQDSRVSENLAVSELGVRAYLGYPVVVNGEVLGSVCAIHTSPHTWTESERTIVEHFAEAVSNKLEVSLERNRFLDHMAALKKNEKCSQELLKILFEEISGPLECIRSTLSKACSKTKSAEELAEDSQEALQQLKAICYILEQAKTETTVFSTTSDNVVIVDVD